MREIPSGSGSVLSGAGIRRRPPSGARRRPWLAGLAALGLALAPGRLAAQSAPGEVPLDSAAWLAGCWAAGEGERRTEEVWMAPAGGVMVGMGRTLRPGRAAGWEHLLLRERDGVLTYTALPSGQSLTHFGAVAAGPGRLRFENPDHDFPRALEYRRAAPDSLRVDVFGAIDDATPAFSLAFAREPCPPSP